MPEREACAVSPQAPWLIADPRGCVSVPYESNGLPASIEGLKVPGASLVNTAGDALVTRPYCERR